jgi:hypothetical protein
MLTPEKIAEIKTQAKVAGRDPDAAIEFYKATLESEQKAQTQANLETWKELGRQHRLGI